jgi:hypothetical protein
VSDADSLLRERLDAAAAVDVEADPVTIRAGVARRQRRIRRRRRTTALVGALVVAGVVLGVVGLLGRDTGDNVAVSAGDESSGSPHFDQARGWNIVQSDAAATAANVILGPHTRAGDAPWDTVATLGQGDVVLYVMFSPAGDSGTGSPPDPLPLSLADAQPGGLEGQPDGVYAERLLAGVDGWNIDVVAFFGGGPPDATTRAAADAELARLVVPARAVAQESLTPARSDACLPSDLVATAALDGRGQSLAGRITVRNVGASACTLTGTATVEPRDSGSTVLPATTFAADPAWRQARASEPEGWPTVRLAPGAEAQAVLQVDNWCGAFDNRLFLVIRLPGHEDRIGGPAPSVQVPPNCTAPPDPMRVGVGPFEPSRAV